jgi:hypothetical protein
MERSATQAAATVAETGDQQQGGQQDDGDTGSDGLPRHDIPDDHPDKRQRQRAEADRDQDVGDVDDITPHEIVADQGDQQGQQEGPHPGEAIPAEPALDQCGVHGGPPAGEWLTSMPRGRGRVHCTGWPWRHILPARTAAA